MLDWVLSTWLQLEAMFPSPLPHMGLVIVFASLGTGIKFGRQKWSRRSLQLDTMREEQPQKCSVACSSSASWLLTLLPRTFPKPLSRPTEPRTILETEVSTEPSMFSPSNPTQKQPDLLPGWPCQVQLVSLHSSLGSLLRDCFSDPPIPSFPSSSHIYVGTDCCS